MTKVSSMLRCLGAAVALAAISSTVLAAPVIFSAEGSDGSLPCTTSGDCTVPAGVSAVRGDPVTPAVGSFLGGTAQLAVTNTKNEAFAMSNAVLSGGPATFDTKYSIFSGTGTITSPGRAENPLNGDFEIPAGKLDNNTNGDVGGYAGRWDTTGDAAATWFETERDIIIELGDMYDVFGLYITDLGDIASYNATITMLLGNSQTGETIQRTLAGDGRVMFFGLYSDTLFNTVTLRFNQDPNAGDRGDLDAIGIDDLVVGKLTRRQPPTDLPEPGSLALLGLALLAAGTVRRRG